MIVYAAVQLLIACVLGLLIRWAYRRYYSDGIIGSELISARNRSHYDLDPQ